MTGFEIFVRSEAEDDLAALGKPERKRVLNAIRQRLGSTPDQYGKPLGGPLHGLRRIRVGDFRVAYQVEKTRVIVWAIKHRKDIYPAVGRRFNAP